MASVLPVEDLTLSGLQFEVQVREARGGTAAPTNPRSCHMASSTQSPLASPATEDFDLEALRRGDTQAFSALVRRYHRILLSVARGMVGGDEAEAVVQESWLKAYQAIGGFEGRARLRTWLTTIVMNEARMHLRKHPHREVQLKQEAGEGFDELFDREGRWLSAPPRWHAPGPEEAMRAEQFGQCLARLLDALPPQQRLVLELRDVQQREMAEIAALLELAEGNVRVLLHRARARVYRGIEHYEEHGQC